ncbi:hypothetical protein G6F70_002147 [Rhizopus microsporus]|uniref:Uncharacterized protein n=1 Tax=Rhizopus microsporus TaxID=58291 RepID=A0A1X0SE54_RHIZD|nr:hypothetical protein G6F71_000698 [Rhizopus microsporus]KAG1202584.1 hypothetical protein G6F70_002147 [Rhizopus microsporus]KAG1213260.1 hypothetical protein G6F69_002955 [Rhizopus microsporus]KAG1235222.1 hypothetical protein G6F67_002907 [Rhizopus microsporus]KAG1267334.1 hypothetical protein G6F68_002040 [Rhizopus microsporus]
MQTNLFKNTSFEASDDDFQETPLLIKNKNTQTIFNASKEDIPVPDPSNVVTSDQTFMHVVNNDTSIEALLHAPIPSSSCTFTSTKATKKYKSKVVKTEVLKKKKEKNKTLNNEQKQVRSLSCDGTDHSRSSSKLCPMYRSKAKLPNPEGYRYGILLF